MLLTLGTRLRFALLFTIAPLVLLVSGTEPIRSQPPQESAIGTPTAFDGDLWGGSPRRNNVRQGRHLPRDWEIGKFDRQTKLWLPEGARNVRWTVPIGTQTYSSPIVTRGRVFLGSNNGAGLLPRFPAKVDLGTMLCFRESTGEFLWQYSSTKMESGRVNDWPLQGIPSTPCVEGDRLWFVDNRGRVVCLDTDGFADGEDDGPVTGVWTPLLRSRLDLADELDQWQIPEVLRDFIGDLDANLSTARLVRNNDTQSWEITRRIRGGWVSICHLALRDEHVDVYPSTANVDFDSAPLRRIDRFPFRGLKEGRISPTLGQLLIRRNIRVSGRTPLVPTDDPHTWTVQSLHADKPRTCRLRISAAEVEITAAVADPAHEADVVWRYDMLNNLNVFQHNLATCSPAVWGDLVFACTSNGVDESHMELPSPQAPSFIALDKRTGELLWQDNSPGNNVMHGQWASPAVGVIDGVPQVIFAGGDGWVYSFRADRWNRETGRPELLWKFDANLKDAKWVLGGRGSRNNIIAFPVIHKDRVYIAMGQDPEHGEGAGRLWCLDATQRGDISLQIVKPVAAGEPPIDRAAILGGLKPEQFAKNPNSGVIWKYDKVGEAFHEEFHRTIASPAIAENILVIPDMSGIIHCLDATTGEVHWICDALAACWGSPLIADGHVYVGTEDGEVLIFPLTSDPTKAIDVGPGENFGDPRRAMSLESSVYSTPTTANNTLFISSRMRLHALKTSPP